MEKIQITRSPSSAFSCNTYAIHISSKFILNNLSSGLKRLSFSKVLHADAALFIKADADADVDEV